MMTRSGRRLQEAEGKPWSRPQLSMPLPADPSSLGDGTLLAESSMNRNICCACSIETWEKKQRESKKKEYKLSIEEQNKSSAYLRCENCGSHFCNLCAQLFIKKIASLPTPSDDDNELAAIVMPILPWCEMVESFLQECKCKEKGFTKDIPSNFCISCQYKKHASMNLVLSTAQGSVCHPHEC